MPTTFSGKLGPMKKSDLWWLAFPYRAEDGTVSLIGPERLAEIRPGEKIGLLSRKCLGRIDWEDLLPENGAVVVDVPDEFLAAMQTLIASHES